MTITTEWPEAGWHGECTWGIGNVWFECRVLDADTLVHTSRFGHWNTLTRVSRTHWQFQPLRTEREKFIKAAAEIIRKEHTSRAINSIDCPHVASAAKLYDAGFRLSEGNDK